MLYYFNGTHDGDNYQAVVTRTTSEYYNVEVVYFDKTTGEPNGSFSRLIRATDNRFHDVPPKRAVRNAFTVARQEGCL